MIDYKALAKQILADKQKALEYIELCPIVFENKETSGPDMIGLMLALLFESDLNVDDNREIYYELITRADLPDLEAARAKLINSYKDSYIWGRLEFEIAKRNNPNITIEEFVAHHSEIMRTTSKSDPNWGLSNLCLLQFTKEWDKYGRAKKPELEPGYCLLM